MKVYEASKDKLETSLKASEDKLSDAQLRLQELQLANGTVDGLTLKVDEAGNALNAYQ